MVPKKKKKVLPRPNCFKKELVISARIPRSLGVVLSACRLGGESRSATLARLIEEGATALEYAGTIPIGAVEHLQAHRDLQDMEREVGDIKSQRLPHSEEEEIINHILARYGRSE